MKHDNTAGNITALSLAGHATETGVWRFVRDVAAQLVALHRKGGAHGAVTLDAVTVEGRSFVLNGAPSSALREGEAKAHEIPVPGRPAVSSSPASAADDIWQLGACIYMLITGVAPFGGQGRAGQTAHTPMPVFGLSRASAALSKLAAQCLAYDAAERITAEAVVSVAEAELPRLEAYSSDLENLKFKKPQNRRVRMKTYDFWPEAMVSLLLLLMFAFPQSVAAQTNAELEKLIRLTTTMRNQSKRAQVLRELRDDDKWTLMDELRVNANECTYKDKVNMFGVNDIAAEIAQRERGIINVGGRFKHSADGKHHYSFIELTALAGKTVSYTVRGHGGEQQIAVVPFDPKCRYTAAFYSDGKEQRAHAQKDGTSYFKVKAGRNGSYEFEITNSDKKNASFVVITYNPMK